MKLLKYTLFIMSSVLLLGQTAKAAEITGAGATFPYPLYAKWADAYQKTTGNKINYQAIGSGGGIKQIEARTVDFGASDMPLKSEDLTQNGLMQWPMVIGGVVPVVHIGGIKSGQLILDGQTLADIYQGKITQWNDPALVKLNPHLALPHQAIAVGYRSDGSGTTFLFSSYLSLMSADWQKNIGANTSIQWSVGFGAKGNEGVSNFVQKNDNSIGYVEFAYAQEPGLAAVKLINHDGKITPATASAFAAAAKSAHWEKADNFYLLLLNQPGNDSWPITGATYILIQKKASNDQGRLEALKFFDWAFKNGAKMADELHYVPLPPSVAQLVRKAWHDQLKTSTGAVLWTKN